MAGHKGDKFRTIQNLEIIKSDPINNLIYIKGSVPGSKNSIVFLQESKKNVTRKTSKLKSEEVEKEKITKESKKSSKKESPKKPEAKKPEAKTEKKK
jgi:large subunit ribosomal protein L3